MKKFIIIGIAVALLLSGAISATAALYYTQVESSTGVASTTATLVIGGTATTTKTVISDGYQQVSYLVALASSTTAPTLCWKNQYSNNGTDWYGGDYVFASSTSHQSADTQDCWTYSTTTAGTNFISYGSDGKTIFVGRKVVVPNLDTVYTRTQFSIVAGGRGLLDVRSSLKNEIVNIK